MISAFGAILLIAAGGYAGFSALEHLRTALRSAETILDASRDMRTEILVTGHPFRSCWSDWGRGIRAFPGCRKRFHARSGVLVSLGLDGEHSLCRAAQGAGRAASSAGDAALLRHGAGAGARCVGRFGPGSCAMRCREKDRAAVRLYPSLALPRLSSCRSASLVFTFSAGFVANCRRVIIEI